MDLPAAGPASGRPLPRPPGRWRGVELGTPGASSDRWARSLVAQERSTRRHARRVAIAASWRRAVARALLIAAVAGIAAALVGIPAPLPTATAAGAVAAAVWWLSLPAGRLAPGADAVAARAGAVAARRTAGELALLPGRGWAVLHDRQLPGHPGGAFDLLIGPSGVFVVASAVLPTAPVAVDDLGELWVGGDHVDLGPLAAQARALWQVLVDELALAGAAVVPILGVHDASLPPGGLRVGGVEVLGASELTDYLARTPAGRLDAAGIRRLAAAAAERVPAASPPRLPG